MHDRQSRDRQSRARDVTDGSRRIYTQHSPSHYFPRLTTHVKIEPFQPHQIAFGRASLHETWRSRREACFMMSVYARRHPKDTSQDLPTLHETSRDLTRPRETTVIPTKDFNTNWDLTLLAKEASPCRSAHGNTRTYLDILSNNGRD